MESQICTVNFWDNSGCQQPGRKGRTGDYFFAGQSQTEMRNRTEASLHQGTVDVIHNHTIIRAAFTHVAHACRTLHHCRTLLMSRHCTKGVPHTV